MEPARGDGPFDDTPLSEPERRALATLESVLKAGASPGLRGLWGRVRFRLLVAWGTRLAISTGLLASLAGIGVMWTELSTAVWVAMAGECLLTAGALLFARGIRLWWYRVHPERILLR